jgi:error-prone DNA polymerase
VHFGKPGDAFVENARRRAWPQVFEQNRRAILNATMLGCRGRVQHASDVIHLIVEHVTDLSAELMRVSGIDSAFPVTSGRGDEAKHSGGGDSREPKPIARPRDMYEPDLHIDTLKVRTRNFR